MYTNQLMMGSSVHTIKTKFINKFIPPGGRLLLKETVITERQRGGWRRWTPAPLAARREGNVCVSVCTHVNHANEGRVGFASEWRSWERPRGAPLPQHFVPPTLVPASQPPLLCLLFPLLPHLTRLASWLAHSTRSFRQFSTEPTLRTLKSVESWS